MSTLKNINHYKKENTMIKTLKAKSLLLSGVLLLSSTGIFGAEGAAAPKNPAEVKYQALLSAGFDKYDELLTFVGQMVSRMKAQYDRAAKAEADLKVDELADEMELETAHADVVGKQFAVRFWEERQAAVNNLKTTAEADRAQARQVATVLPDIRQAIDDTIAARHAANEKFAALRALIATNADFLKSVPELRDLIPTISFESSVKQVMQESKIQKFGDAVESYLRALLDKARSNEKDNKGAAVAVERSSNAKMKKTKKGAGSDSGSSGSDGGVSDADSVSVEG